MKFEFAKNVSYKSKAPPKLVAAILLPTGIFLIFFGVSTFFKTKNFLANAITANGTVVKNAISDDGKTYRPIISYTTQIGEQVEFSQGVSTNPPAFKVGESVEVIYSQNEPYDAKVNTPFYIWFPAGTLLFVGILLAVIAVFVLNQSKISQNSQNS